MRHSGWVMNSRFFSACSRVRSASSLEELRSTSSRDRPSACSSSAASPPLPRSGRSACLIRHSRSASLGGHRQVRRGRRCSISSSIARSPSSATKRGPTSARPSLMYASGVLISWIDASTRPCSRTSRCSFDACSRWWPGKRLVGHGADELVGAHGQVRVDLDPRTQVAVVPVVGRPRLVGDDADRRVTRRRVPRRLACAARRSSSASQSRTAGRRSAGTVSAFVACLEPRRGLAAAGQQLVQLATSSTRTPRAACARAAHRSSARPRRRSRSARRRASGRASPAR